MVSLPISVLILFLAGSTLVVGLLVRRLLRLERQRLARLDELIDRLEAVEREASRAVTQSQVTAGVLVDKGLADEEELEAMRRRFDADAEVPEPRRTDERLH